MDFFEHQDRARRKTGLLVFYFVLAVILMIAAIYATAIAVFSVAAPQGGVEPSDWFQPDILLLVTGGTLLVIGLGSLYKIAELRSGGEAVATMLGGRRVLPNTTDPSERRVLNVVEEMAIASGIAVPPVFLLGDEPGINAFAAGFTADDAVIGVNRGTLDFLTRDELQGVIAHEFSHILNGDMRFNLRLIGLLHGILLLGIIGYYMLRMAGSSGRSRSSRSDGKGGGSQLMLLGLAMMVVGFVGLLFGRLIKAAVSRQREYLADASAVQFTRNPAGLAGALKKIGGLVAGSTIETPEAETASHMFFGSSLRRMAHSPFATHPPLVQRIQCIDPAFDGRFPKVTPVRPEPPQAKKTQTAKQKKPTFGFGKSLDALTLGGKLPLDPAVVIAAVGAPTSAHVAYSAQLLAAMPAPLAGAAHESFSARAVIFALLLDADASVRTRQLQIIEHREGAASAEEAVRLAAWLEQLDKAARLPLLKVVQGTLRQLAVRQYQQFRGTVEQLIEADRRVTLLEFVLQRVLLRQLDRAFELVRPPLVRYHTLAAVEADVRVLLSALARVGLSAEDAAAAVFQRAWDALPGRADTPILPADACDLAAIHRALNKLEEASPPIKKKVLSAATLCVVADGRVTIREAELLRAIASSLDCPLPPVVASPGRTERDERDW